jgi:hypothetical protein
MANQPNLTEALNDAAYTLEGLAVAADTAAADARATLARARAGGFDPPLDPHTGRSLPELVARLEADAGRYRRGAESARRGFLLSGSENRNDTQWWAQFSTLFARAHREARVVNPDEGPVARELRLT